MSGRYKINLDIPGNVKHVTPDQRVMVDDKSGHLKFVKPLQNVKCDDLYGNSKFVRPKQHVKVDDGILQHLNPNWKPEFKFRQPETNSPPGDVGAGMQMTHAPIPSRHSSRWVRPDSSVHPAPEINPASPSERPVSVPELPIERPKSVPQWYSPRWMSEFSIHPDWTSERRATQPLPVIVH